MLDRRLGFAQLNDGQPASRIVPDACFSCHEAVKAREFVFTRYAYNRGVGLCDAAPSSIFNLAELAKQRDAWVEGSNQTKEAKIGETKQEKSCHVLENLNSGPLQR